MVAYFDDKYKMPSWISFYDHDLHLLNEEHEGFRLDADEFCGLDFTLLKFEQKYWPKLKQDQKFKDAGIESATTSQKKTIFFRLVESARRYRDQNRKPTDEEIAAAVAVGAARDDALAQLEEGKAALLDLKNNHEGKIKQMKNDRKSKEADYKELQDQLRTLENEHGITQGKLRVTTENLQETNDNRQKLVEEIKTKDIEISSLKKQINELENPDSKVYLQLADKLIERNKEELLLDHLKEGRKLKAEGNQFESSKKQNTDLYESSLAALLHSGCDPDDITSTLCEINKKGIADKHDSEIKKVTDKYQREHESMEERNRIARDEIATTNGALRRLFMENIADLKTRLADLQLKYDALKEETATESQLRAELKSEKEKNQRLEVDNMDLKFLAS